MFSKGEQRQAMISNPRVYLYVAAEAFNYCLYMFLMRDEKEEQKKQARSNKQTRQSNTAHPRQSLFLEKMSCLGWDSNP